MVSARQHCYHPACHRAACVWSTIWSIIRATVLVWPALGGGSIALPYLEQEAFGPIDSALSLLRLRQRQRVHSGVSRRGIKIFGIVFEVQGGSLRRAERGRGHQFCAQSSHAAWVKPALARVLREFSQKPLIQALASLRALLPRGLNSNQRWRARERPRLERAARAISTASPLPSALG